MQANGSLSRLQASLDLRKDNGAHPHRCPGFLKACIYAQLRNKGLSAEASLKADHAAQYSMPPFQAKNYTDFLREVSPTQACGFTKNPSVVSAGEVCQYFSGL